MIEKFIANNPHIPHRLTLLHQTADDPDFSVPEQPIVCIVDQGGMIVLSQEGRHLLVNPSSVPELLEVLTDLHKVGSGDSLPIDPAYRVPGTKDASKT